MLMPLKSGVIYLLLFLACLHIANCAKSNSKYFRDFIFTAGVTDQDSDELLTTTTERDREPLSSDFEDPKNDEDKKATTNDPDRPEFGIIDIPANGNGGSEGFLGTNFFNDYFPSFPKFDTFFNIFKSVSTGRQPWWKGPNVCTEKEEIVESPDRADDDAEAAEEDTPGFFSNINFSSCAQTPTRYQCTTKVGSRGKMKTFIIKYKCCHGYQRQPNQPGCTKLDLKNIKDTCAELAGNEFLSMVKTAGLEESIEAENITVFVPSDQAMKDYNEKMLELNEVELSVLPARKRREGKRTISSRELIQSHIVDKLVEINDLSNGDVVHSEYDDSTIRINMYPTPSDEILITANCIPVVKKDNMATNGIIHVIDGVMTPVTKSIRQIIGENRKFTILNRILEKAGLEDFFDEKKVYTFFAPSDAAFEKLKPELREKLMKGDGCVKNILKHHILSHSICSNAITFNATTHDLEGNTISLRRDDDNKLIIEDIATVTERDLMATNGIIHTIDTVIIPESGMDAGELLTKHNLTAFQNLLKEADMTSLINDMKNVTLLVPTNEAIKAAESEIAKLKEDKSKLQELVLYHTVPGELKSCDFNNDAIVKSGFADNKLRVNLYNTLPFFRTVYNKATVNCAKLVHIDEQACGSVIHEINKVLIPPTESVLSIVQNNEEYSIFADLLNGTKLQEELEDENSSFTILAPTNKAFGALSQKTLKKLQDDKEKADMVLRLHVLPEVICCSGVGYQSFPFTEKVRTMGPYSLSQGHDMRDRVRFADASVTKCDNMATNGIVHTVNKVILPPKRQVINPFADLNIMFFNL